MEPYAQQRYQQLSAEREDFLHVGREAAALTLPYLLTEDGFASGGKLTQPWQSIGAKGVNVLGAKLMLGLFPINTSFFKLQINDAELAQLPELSPEIRSEVDLSLSKMERMVMQRVAETNDRVQLHTAMKHLIVTGNALVFAGKKNLKVYPLDRYVINRDGDGNVIEIITKEVVDRQLLPKDFQTTLATGKDSNAPGEDGPKFGVASPGKNGKDSDATVYTCVKRINGQHTWHQECDGKIIPGTKSTSPLKFSPWLPCRFNVADGESYGRGRVEEFIGDLKSLESLMQSMVEGSSSAAKVVFLVAPSATLKPKSLATASNGAIIQGRADDVSVVSVAGKTADFRTVQTMIDGLTQRLSDAFLILNVRDSERTTATEVQAVQQELNEQLSGVFGSLTTELLTPYLDRKLHLLRKTKAVPALPKGVVTPVVVAGIYGVGRGQDKTALMGFVQTISQAMGPEALQQYINPQEFMKRLAAASGIDTLNLIKDPATMEQEQQKAQQQGMMNSLVGQAGQLAKSPIGEQLLQNGQGNQEAPTSEAPPSPDPGGDLQS